MRKLSPIADQLELFDRDVTLAPGVDALHSPGHTPGSTVFVASGDGRRGYLLGDVVHSTVELEEPDWRAIFDEDPELASQTRNRLADELAASGDLVAGAHFPGLNFGRLVLTDGHADSAHSDPLFAAGHRREDDVVTYGAQLTIGQIPHLHAQSHLLCRKVAIVDGDTRLTWADVSARTEQLANGLASLGVGKGTKVAVILTNRAQYVEIVYAVAGLGAAVVPISYRFTPGEIAYAVGHSDAEVVIVDGQLTGTFAAAHESLPHIPTDHVLVVAGPDASTGYLDYETLLAGSSTDRGYLDMDEWDVYHLAFTGGTSGDPKACEIPQRIARQGWYDITVEVGNRANDVTVIAGPFYHGLGFTWGLQQLMVGGTIVMLREFDARELLQTIERERVSFVPMVPTMIEMLLEVGDKASFDVGSVRRLMSAGSPLLTASKERLLEFFPEAGLYELYGSTEAGFFSILKPEDQLRKERSAGLPYIGCELRILDPGGADVPVGAVGQIYKRGPGLGVRYYKNPQATEDQFRGEWISSGDLGRFDEEGYLYVVDRAKDMIISGGVNIFPTEIENVLVSHPDIVEAAVIGHPDPKWGEIVTAYVVTRDGIPVPEGELDALCREKLASYKRPRVYLAIDELPKNASGKLLKRVLKDQVAQ